ncbi:hypothetical protein HDU87_001311 [Geranomyces variabilis]|uniref:Barwin domain-containing protein n=1 Tax=Geranomyces variabilis TaxID=109894 RepID=A0AAD5TMM0_9FUNG|nr:hypothetical protein HDU87_001311 [Geranomyces variabilis]
MLLHSPPTRGVLVAVIAILTQAYVVSGDASANLTRRWAPGIAYEGRMTYYGDGYKGLQNGQDPPPLGPQNGGWYGACYNVFQNNPAPLIPKNFNAFAALNTLQFTTLTPQVVCGTCLSVLHQQSGLSTIVQIVDHCPGCPPGGIDIAHTAFGKLLSATSATAGWAEATHVGAVPDVVWHVVSCDALPASNVFEYDGVPADALLRKREQQGVPGKGLKRLGRTKMSGWI